MLTRGKQDSIINIEIRQGRDVMVDTYKYIRKMIDIYRYAKRSKKNEEEPDYRQAIADYLESEIKNYKERGHPIIYKLALSSDKVRNTIKALQEDDNIVNAISSELKEVTGKDVSKERVKDIIGRLSSVKRTDAMLKHFLAISIERAHDKGKISDEDYNKYLMKPAQTIAEGLNTASDSEHVRQLIERALWYIYPHHPEYHEHNKKATMNVARSLGMSEDEAKRLSNMIHADTKEYMHLLRHDGMTNKEKKTASLAHAIAQTNKAPWSGVYHGVVAATSPIRDPATNIINALFSTATMVRGGSPIVHPAINDMIGTVGTSNVAKISTLIKLCQEAIQGKEAPKYLDDESRKIYSNALSYLRGLRDTAIKGIKHEEKTYKLSKEHANDPAALASIFLTASHKIDDIKPVWSVINHYSKQVTYLSSLDHTLRHYTLPKDPNGAEKIAELDRHMHNRDIRSYLNAAKAMAEENPELHGRAMKELKKAEEALNKTKIRLIPNKEVFDMYDKKHDEPIAGILGLGPKIGAYGANLLGHLHHLTVDTWEARLYGMFGKRMGTVVSMNPNTNPKLKAKYRAIINETAKEAIRNSSMLNALREQIKGHVTDNINRISNELGISPEQLTKYLNSTSSLQAMRWHQIRSTIYPTVVHHPKQQAISSLHHANESISTHYKEPSLPGEPYNFFHRSIAYQNTFANKLRNTLTGTLNHMLSKEPTHQNLDSLHNYHLQEPKAQTGEEPK